MTTWFNNYGKSLKFDFVVTVSYLNSKYPSGYRKAIDLNQNVFLFDSSLKSWIDEKAFNDNRSVLQLRG